MTVCKQWSSSDSFGQQIIFDEAFAENRAHFWGHYSNMLTLKVIICFTCICCAACPQRKTYFAARAGRFSAHQWRRHAGFCMFSSVTFTSSKQTINFGDKKIKKLTQKQQNFLQVIVDCSAWGLTVGILFSSWKASVTFASPKQTLLLLKCTSVFRSICLWLSKRRWQIKATQFTKYVVICQVFYISI